MSFHKSLKVLRQWCVSLKFSTSAINFKITPKKLKSRKKSSQDWLTRHLNDPYVKLSKIEQYRARSAYKLIEIDDKYKILKPGQTIVECGAAPGAWTQVIVKRINSLQKEAEKPVGKVIAADLLHFTSVNGAVTFTHCDFTSQESQQLIQNELKNKKVDLILSDMAPCASGSKELDHECIIRLVSSALEFAKANSRQGSHFLCKLWEGYKTKEFLLELKQFYETTKIVKPNASRSESSEVYVLAKNFKVAPSSPDS